MAQRGDRTPGFIRNANVNSFARTPAQFPRQQLQVTRPRGQVPNNQQPRASFGGVRASGEDVLFRVPRPPLPRNAQQPAHVRIQQPRGQVQPPPQGRFQHLPRGHFPGVGSRPMPPRAANPGQVMAVQPLRMQQKQVENTAIGQQMEIGDASQLGTDVEREALITKIKELQAENDQMDLEIDQKTKSLQEVRSLIDENARNDKELNLVLEEINSASSKYAMNYDVLKARLGELDRLKNCIANMEARDKAVFRDGSAACAQIKAKIENELKPSMAAKLSNAKANFDAEIAAMEKGLANLEIEKGNALARLNAAKTREREMTNAVSEKIKALASLAADSAKMEKDIRDAEAEVAECELRLKEVTEEEEKVLEEIRLEEGVEKVAFAELEEVDRSLCELNAALADETQFDLRAETAELENEITQSILLDEELKLLVQRQLEMKQKNIVLKHELDELEAAAQASALALLAKETELDSILASERELKELAATRESLLAQAKAAVGHKEAQLDEANDSLEAARSKQATAEQNRSRAKAVRDDAKAKVEAKRLELSTADDGVSEKGQLAALQMKQTELRAKIDRVEGENREAVARMKEETEATMTPLLNETAKLQQEIALSKAKLEVLRVNDIANTTQAKELAAKLNEVKEKRATLESRKTELEQRKKAFDLELTLYRENYSKEGTRKLNRMKKELEERTQKLAETKEKIIAMEEEIVANAVQSPRKKRRSRQEMQIEKLQKTVKEMLKEDEQLDALLEKQQLELDALRGQVVVAASSTPGSSGAKAKDVRGTPQTIKVTEMKAKSPAFLPAKNDKALTPTKPQSAHAEAKALDSSMDSELRYQLGITPPRKKEAAKKKPITLFDIIDDDFLTAPDDPEPARGVLSKDAVATAVKTVTTTPGNKSSHVETRVTPTKLGKTPQSSATTSPAKKSKPGSPAKKGRKGMQMPLKDSDSEDSGDMFNMTFDCD